MNFLLFVILSFRGLSVGIYTTNNAEACQYVCSDAECNIVVVENDSQLQKILEVIVFFLLLFEITK